mmetsp:Transcript_1519/g.5697  ORF Transcript_1519/g.5697 Transcript_1519/m.5697 type:complete len:208 (+) Transcript_1519:599-1222(+)
MAWWNGAICVPTCRRRTWWCQSGHRRRGHGRGRRHLRHTRVAVAAQWCNGDQERSNHGWCGLLRNIHHGKGRTCSCTPCYHRSRTSRGGHHQLHPNSDCKGGECSESSHHLSNPNGNARECSRQCSAGRGPPARNNANTGCPTVSGPPSASREARPKPSDRVWMHCESWMDGRTRRASTSNYQRRGGSDDSCARCLKAAWCGECGGS